MADWVVLAVGNDARGDDALGPLLLDRLAASAWPGVRTVLDFQFQVEHALDLEGAAGAVFVDAHRQQAELVQLVPLEVADGVRAGSHVLSPGEVLAVGRRLGIALPAAWVLSLRGEGFELAAGLSPIGARSLEAGWQCLSAFLRSRLAPGGAPAGGLPAQIGAPGADMATLAPAFGASAERPSMRLRSDES